MITVPQITETLIKRSRYLSEAISKELINTSALARYIKPEVEHILHKKVSEASILMAIKRLSENLTPKYSSHDVFSTPPQMIVFSEVTLFVCHTSPHLHTIMSDFSKETRPQSLFLTMQHTQIIIVCSQDLAERFSKEAKSDIDETIQECAAITIVIPHEITNHPGIFYFFIKSLAWEGINILELISVKEEITMIFAKKDVKNAYAILQGLFK